MGRVAIAVHPIQRTNRTEPMLPNNDSLPSQLQSTFSIPKMDCPSEENLIRMALADLEDVRLKFDLVKRELTATHRQPASMVLERLAPLKLGAALRESIPLPSDSNGVQQSLFSVPKMDCPSEENLIRMALQGVPGISSLSFDLGKRQVTVVHQDNAELILEKLQPLNLGAVLLQSTPMLAQASGMPSAKDTDGEESATLWRLLMMNATMFIIELAVGLYAQSTGLIADSLDMFADAAVYGLALYAVGRAAHIKVRAAHVAGWLQILLGLMALVEVGRSFFLGSEPRSTLMIGISSLALVVNVASLMMIAKKKHYGAHMKASYIFSANDVIANLGVIVAGVLVAWTGSPYPDLAIGTVITLIVLNGARRILNLR